MTTWETGQVDSGPLTPLQSRQPNLKDLAYEAIRSAIITRAIPPGARVSEARLAANLNVSKTPVREALLRLASIGLVESDGRYGVRIPQPSLQALRAAYDVREGLEVQSARLAALRELGADGLAEAQRLAKECLGRALASDEGGFRELDREFHLALAGIAGNAYLSRVISDAYDLAWSLRLRDAPVAGDAVDCGHQHIDILAAVARQDADDAEICMRRHITKVRDAVITSYNSNRSAESDE